ncbi:uncharacterized protein DNG_08356 [Cephalotrichum gorgonifer]|uniref:Post-SET domain-containing protein n=1 Tax=Cephalotrichum gorgonifer TaxID=2041049 RepID=A0AAE8SYB2_9PEZI|nr:uncharacterized protein DNG_08356 [Cephalotrichum gorgonifer]
MEPIKPHWAQPSHPDRLEIVANEAAFTSKSIALADFPPFAVFSKLTFPPCTTAEVATYATVQTGVSSHLDLNSDLLYINHSCEPSLIFDTSSLNVIVGPRGLKKGDELSFFYPSTEWHMAQPFKCLCGTPSCRGTISGARDMSPAQLEGVWINAHIRELIEQRDSAVAAANGTNGTTNGSSVTNGASDATAEALRDAITQAESVVASTRAALKTYLARGQAPAPKAAIVNGSGVEDPKAGLQRRGASARALAGEMGGDTN